LDFGRVVGHWSLAGNHVIPDHHWSSGSEGSTTNG
jgi:hypothetical protein